MARQRVTPKDLMVVMGWCERWSQIQLKMLRAKLGKNAGQVITVQEACDEWGLKPGNFEGVL